MDYLILDADPELHAPAIHKLVQALYVYQRYSDSPRHDADALCRDLRRRCSFAVIAVTADDGQAIGYGMYSLSWAPTIGIYLLLEGLFIQPDFRRRGVGTALWRRIAQIAVSQGIGCIQWNVLHWNQSALDFYHRLPNVISLGRAGNWCTLRLDATGIRMLAAADQLLDTDTEKTFNFYHRLPNVINLGRAGNWCTLRLDATGIRMLAAADQILDTNADKTCKNE